MTSTFDKKIQEVLNRAKEHAALDKTVWIPQVEGETIAGQIIEIGYMVVKIFGEVHTTLLKCDDGEHRRLSWGGATLRPAWDRFNPEVSDYVVAAYHGMREAKTEGFGEYADVEVVVLNDKGEKKVSIINTVDTKLAVSNGKDRSVLREGEEAFEGADD